MSPTTPHPEPEKPPGGRGRAWPWLIALATAGMLLSALPHLIDAARSGGDPTYIADGDGLLYLAWSRDAVREGAWSLTDAVHRPSGPAMHPWLLFIPPARMAHALGLGMTGLAVVWRLIAGVVVALGLYAAVRPFTATPRGAAGLAAFLLFDAGTLFGQIVQRDVEIVVSIVRGTGTFFKNEPRVMPHLRVPTPAFALPFLLVHYGLARRARRLGTTWAALAAGASLGLLFHVYFYFATAVGLGTVVAWLLDRGGRRTYLVMLATGVVVAAPAVLLQARIKAETPRDWLVRTDKFVPVARLDSARLLVPKVLILEWLIATWVVFRSRRDLLYLWACTGAGLLLVNQHVITGFDLENFHWSQAYGLTFSLVLALTILPWLERWRAWSRIAVWVVAVQVAVGLGLRAFETVRSAETNSYRAMLADWRDGGFAIAPGSVVAGPPELLLLLAAVEDIDPLDGRLVDFSSAATDEERDQRYVLNLLLMGFDRAEAAAEIEALSESRGHVSAASRARRLQLLPRIADEQQAWVNAYKVTHVVVPARLSGRHSASVSPPVWPRKTWSLRLIEPVPTVANGR